jgi:hypothetical protein
MRENSSYFVLMKGLSNVERIAGEIVGVDKKYFLKKYAKATREQYNFLVYDKVNDEYLHNYSLMIKKTGGIFDHYTKKQMEGVQPDLYITPDKGIEPIVSFLEWMNIPKDTCIFEPCAGTHAITNFLKLKGYDNFWREICMSCLKNTIFLPKIFQRKLR